MSLVEGIERGNRPCRGVVGGDVGMSAKLWMGFTRRLPDYFIL